MQVLNKYKDPIPEGAVWIMRPGFWGNPFSIGRDGDRETVLAKYRRWLDRMLQSEKREVFLEALKKLATASALICCCKPKDCHGDILVAKMRELKLIPEATVQEEELCKQKS